MKFEGGGTRRFLSSTLTDFHPEFSPDGKRIAFSSARSSGINEIWVANADGSNPSQLTASTGPSVAPRWSPDGRWLAFSTRAAGNQWDVAVVDPSGGPLKMIVQHPADDSVSSWSRDGKWIYFSSNRGGGQEIYRVPAAGGEPVQITDQGGWVSVESFDGRTLYYTKIGTGPSPLFARPVEGGPEKQVLESVLHRNFVVAKEGIYHIDRPGDDGTCPLRLFRFAGGKSEILTRIDGEPGYGLTVSPDGKTILYALFSQYDADLMLVENFR